MNLEQLIGLGFDRSYEDDEGLHMRCSQCEALAIQGVPCHEHGCPHQTHECEECDTQIPKGHRLCESCANPEPYIEDSINTER